MNKEEIEALTRVKGMIEESITLLEKKPIDDLGKLFFKQALVHLESGFIHLVTLLRNTPDETKS